LKLLREVQAVTNSQRCIWESLSSGMWLCVNGLFVHHYVHSQSPALKIQEVLFFVTSGTSHILNKRQKSENRNPHLWKCFWYFTYRLKLY